MSRPLGLGYDKPLQANSQLGRYHLGEQIGSGGMAEVFRGELSGAEGFSRPVAIKRVRTRLVGDSDTARNFIEEARLAQRLQHGNIVQTHDLGIEDGVPYIVMEFVDGMSLAELMEHNLRCDHRLGIATILYIIEAVAEALDYAHRLADQDGNSDGVVHRDVNPRNILLSTDGIVKLTDFGIAKGMNMKPRTLPGRVKGTLGYLSPEQAYGGIIGPPTDQFATGVVLYQLLAGHNPLAGATKIREYRKMLDEGLPRLEGPGVDDELRAIVHRATASKFDARFASMSEFRQTLEAWRVARGVRTSLDGVRDIVRTYRGGKTPRRAPVAKLDNALLAQLAGESKPRRDTRSLASAEAIPKPPKRKWAAIVSAVFAVAVLVVVVIVASGDTESGAPEIVSKAGAAGDELDAIDREIEEELADLDEDDDSATGKAETESEIVIDDEPDPFDDAAAELAAKQVAERKARVAKEEARKKAKKQREKEAVDAKAAAAEKRREAERKKAAEAKKVAVTGTGTIRVNVLPYAEVSVDGKKRGRTPTTITVSAGTHRVRLFNPGTGKSTTKTITVGDRENKSITSW